MNTCHTAHGGGSSRLELDLAYVLVEHGLEAPGEGLEEYPEKFRRSQDKIHLDDLFVDSDEVAKSR